MGYRLLYDGLILFDPYTDNVITDATLSFKTNAVAYFDFTIGPKHSLYDVIAERAGKVEVYFDDLKLYSGKITEMTTDLECYKSVSCSGVLAYLGDTVVRPYSTVEGEQNLKAPSSVDGYFQWLIDQHNENCLDSEKQFQVGVNQGAMLDNNNYIYRSSEQRPSTSSEIEDKILDSLGGYLFVRYDGDANILDLYADAHEANTQIIDFGVNIVDFSKTIATSDQYTAVVATGYTPDPPEDDPNKKMKPISLSSINDGGTPYSNIIKMGDKVYNIDAVQRYGYREYYVNNTDITTYDGLLEYACQTLNRLISPSLSVTVKAVDLALYMNNGYEHFQLGQAVRVRSKPYSIDEYLMINSITLDLQDPGNTEYELGVTYDTLTGQQSAYLKSLNSSINASLDTVAALGDDVKNAAKKAEEAKDTADIANDTANTANNKAESANTIANEAKDTANEANSKANEATNKSDEAITASKDAADKASEASKKADEATAKTELIENTLTEISGNTEQAIANAKKAQEAADAAKTAANNAQTSADNNATEVGKVKSQVETINTEIANVKKDATDIRDDLSSQINTVKNTMEADYSRKTDLTETTETLRNEISESAAGVLRTVSTDYASKEELKTTTDATNKNAQDLTTAIKKFDGDIDNLQGQIDGSIQTWFYEVPPTDKNEPAVNWTTTDLKNIHLGDLYYDTITGYCYRYQVQNRTYSWQRITDVDVTKALADAAKAQDTADHKRRVFVNTPTTPYDIGDLWVQGTNGDIMRCQVSKTSSQSYSVSDWVKASKYTDDTATNALSNYVEKTYSTKSEVKQLSDTVSSTVSSLETVRVNAEAAQTSAENAQKAADDAQKAADAAKTNATKAQTTADTAQKNLEVAKKNLESLQNQADATDDDLAVAKANVEKAQKAATDAQKAADTANTNASNSQAAADAAKMAADNAQKDVNNLKNRVTAAETSIKQNADEIALRATKTEVINTVDNVSIGGRNLTLNTGNEFKYTPIENRYYFNPIGYPKNTPYGINRIHEGGEFTVSFDWKTENVTEAYYLGISLKHSASSYGNLKNNIALIPIGESNGSVSFSFTPTSEMMQYGESFLIGDFKTRIISNGKLYISNFKLEKGNKATDWTPAPEDVESDYTTKNNKTLSDSKSYTDSQLKIASDSISSTVSSIKKTADTANTNASSAINMSNYGRNLTLNTGNELILTTSGNSRWYDEKIGYPKNTPYGIDRIHEGGEFTVSFDWKTENVTEAFKLYVGLKYSASGYSWITNESDMPNIPIGESNGSVSFSFTPTSEMMQYGESFLIGSGPSGKPNVTGSLRLSDFKLEKGSTKTSWTPAPEDLGTDYLTSSETKSLVKQTSDSLTTTITKAQTTADDAKESTNTLETLIRQSGDGVEVAKKIDGVYTSTKTLVDSDGFYVQDSDGKKVSSFTKDKIELGNDSPTSEISLRNDTIVISSNVVEEGNNTSSYTNFEDHSNGFNLVNWNVDYDSDGNTINNRGGEIDLFNWINPRGEFKTVNGHVTIVAHARNGSASISRDANITLWTEAVLDQLDPDDGYALINSYIDFTADYVRCNGRGVANLVWMFGERSNTDTSLTYSAPSGWHTTTWNMSNFFVGPSYDKYFEIGDGGSKACIKIKKSGYYRLKNTVSGMGGNIMSGLFSSESSSGELFTSVNYGNTSNRTTTTVEALILLNIDDKIYFRVGCGSAWIKDCSARFSNSIIEYLGPK